MGRVRAVVYFSAVEEVVVVVIVVDRRIEDVTGGLKTFAISYKRKMRTETRTQVPCGGSNTVRIQHLRSFCLLPMIMDGSVDGGTGSQRDHIYSLLSQTKQEDTRKSAQNSKDE